MWVPHKINNNKKKTKEQKKRKEREVAREREKESKVLFIFLFFSHFSIRFTEIGLSEFVRGRSKVLYSMRATRRNQKHGISPSF